MGLVEVLLNNCLGFDVGFFFFFFLIYVFVPVGFWWAMVSGGVVGMVKVQWW